jgi:L-asparaginase II
MYTKLVDVYRGGIVESTHCGHIAIVDPKGDLIHAVGDPYRKTFARSSVKPIQAIPLIETGAADHYNLNDKELALCCASHNGEAQHTDTVLELLERSGLVEEHLKCGTHIPKCQDAYKKIIHDGREITSRYNNCSGKHTGMLLTAKYMNESLEDYYLPEHPVQQRIFQAMSDLADYPLEKIEFGVDGCGLPVFALPLERFAYAFARMAHSEVLGAERSIVVDRITTAMMKAPEMVAGTDRFCTDFMRIGKGRVFGKSGAEGVYCIGDKETGVGIAIKIEDGNGRATFPIAVEVLRQLGIYNERQVEEAMKYYKPTLKNCREEDIGQIVASFTL